jgi:hypothetical protein
MSAISSLSVWSRWRSRRRGQREGGSRESPTRAGDKHPAAHAAIDDAVTTGPRRRLSAVATPGRRARFRPYLAAVVWVVACLALYAFQIVRLAGA